MGLSDSLDRAAAVLRAADPRVDGGFLGLVLGSGLGGVADALRDAVVVPYDRIPGFCPPTVPGHGGRVVSGTLRGAHVVALQGRVHLYEGHPEDEVVHGVRTLARLGAAAVVLTNAAGGVRPGLQVGDLVVIEDHINLTGRTPLMGRASLELGPRFPDVTYCWEPRLRDAIMAAGLRAGVRIQRGVYAGMLGPAYETPAEVRMIRALGGDVVGMSTVLEALALAQMGCRVGGLSTVSNAAAGTGAEGETLDHAHIADVAIAATGATLAVLDALLDARGSWWP